MARKRFRQFSARLPETPTGMLAVNDIGPTLAGLLAAELELRGELLRACIADDRGEPTPEEHVSPTNTAVLAVEMLPLSVVAAGEPWPRFAALDELRLVERRVLQLREAMK